MRSFERISIIMPKDADAILLRSMQLATIFEWMTTKKLTKLNVDFNGEGDSGSFDDYVEVEYPDGVKYTNGDYANLQNELNKYTPTLGGTCKEGGSERTLNKLIVHLAEDIEKETDHGHLRALQLRQPVC